MSYVSEYSDLLIKQYWEKTNAKAEIELQATSWETIFNFLKSFETEFDIEFADTDRLDIIGRIVGVGRSVPSILKKIFFGFDDNPDVTGFDDKFVLIGDLGPLFDKFGEEYTTLQLDDSDFRFFIEAKITQNNAHGIMLSDDTGDFKSIQDAAIVLFGGLAYVEDNFDMSITLHIDPTMNEERTRVIMQLDLLPRPHGVQYFLVESDMFDTFGFNDNTNSKAFKNKDAPIVEAGGKFLEKLI